MGKCESSSTFNEISIQSFGFAPVLDQLLKIGYTFIAS